MSEGKVVILSGPSGVGKDTLIEAWSRKNSRVKRVVTYTTRQPRNGEVNGKDYHFVDVPTFMRYVEEGKFLEWKNVHENWYASPLADLREMVGAGDIAVLKIDVQGAMAAMQVLEGEITVFIMPPSLPELERRIRDRHTDNEHQIDVRLQNARDEIAKSDLYAYIVVNDDVDKAVEQLEAIVK